MATVLKGYDPRFKRDVAIKLLPREFLHDPQFRARFEREAQTIAALEHPAIVPVYDFGDAEGQLYLVMRLMTGGSLAERLEKGPLSIIETARIFERLAPALDSAHALGIIHRDLKPANILFDQWSNPYLSDFGIAKLIAGSSTALTATGGLVGTPAYMSPEQVRGVDELDGRSDIYAMGVILFQMLTGKLPYHANTPIGLAFMHVTEPIPNILDINSSLPEAYQTVVGQAMAKEQAARPRTAAALAGTISGLALGKSFTIPDSGAKETIVDQRLDKIETEQLEVAQPELPNTTNLPLTALEGELYLEQQGRNIPNQELNAGSLLQPAAKSKKSVFHHIPAWGWAVIGIVGIVLIFGLIFLFDGNNFTDEVTTTLNNPVVVADVTVLPTKTLISSNTPMGSNITTPEPTEQPSKTPTSRPTNTPTLRPTKMTTPTLQPTNTSIPLPLPTATLSRPPINANLYEIWIRPADNMEMVYVPSGSFLMGSSQDDLVANSDELPQHRVRLTNFWIDSTEITNDQYALYINSTGHVTTAEEEGESWVFTDGRWEKISGANWKHPQGPDSNLDELGSYPVTHISWIDALIYCAWVGGYLPTEAQWEYAARGPDNFIFPWGNDPPDPNLANYDLSVGGTTPVGNYPGGVSWVGSYDMAGNVWEWVNDWYDENYYKNSPITDPPGSGSGRQRVLRGGSWINSSSYLRAATRSNGIVPVIRQSMIGFRCVVSPSP